MKTRSMAAAFAVAVLMAGFAVSTASAAPPQSVVINIQPNPFGTATCHPYQCGTWHLATDSFGDSGQFRSFDFQSSPPNRPFCAPGPFREHFLLTSSGANGSLTVNAEERITGTCPNLVQSGVWQIEPGTGAYADASGHGDVSASHSGLFVTLTFAGVISKTT
jgi:hypothetical protein